MNVLRHLFPLLLTSGSVAALAVHLLMLPLVRRLHAKSKRQLFDVLPAAAR